MKLVNGVSAFILICATLAQDTTKIKNNNPPQEDREGKNLGDLSNQDWKAADLPSSTSAWSLGETEPKRRRLRKRKRRPPLLGDQIGEETTLRRARPQRLDQIREPWEEMSAESVQKSNSRRRLTPVYDEVEKIRDPFTALQEAEEKQKKTAEETMTISELKSLLKQSGGLSISEVLQQKNLSLAELLKGNRQAISALAKNAETTTEVPKRLTPSISSKIDKMGTSLEVQRKRLALLHGTKDSTMFPGVTKVDVVTEKTTDKRIFVPSSKYYTSVDYRPSFRDLTTTPMTTTKKTTRELPVTSAKLNKLVSKVGLPEKAVTISLNQIFGFNATEAGPFKMSIDLVEMTTERAKTTLEEKLKRVTAKEEIMEIMKNPSDREYFEKILKTRNMTFQELVELRERGSSQVHLADIFHNKTREPEPDDEPFIGHIDSADFNSFPFFNRKSKSRTLITTPPTQEIITTKPLYTITSFPTYKIETNKELGSFLPIWKQLYPPFFSGFYNNEEQLIKQSTTESINDDLGSFEDIENALDETTNSKLNVASNHQVYNDNEFIALPSGVKSAILASLAIIGLSLLVFLTILVIFKWTQKQKRRLNYTGSFSGSKIKSPILEPDQKSSFKTFMTETLGRKRMKNYYKTHLQSMSDNFWDDSEKKSYMI